MELTDELIMSFVDGDLAFDEYQTVAIMIDNDEAALKKVEVYKKSKKLLHKEFGHFRKEKPPAYLIDTVQKHFKKKSNILYFFPKEHIQSMAAMLFIGLFIGIFVMDFRHNTDNELQLDASAKLVSPTSINNDKHSFLSLELDELTSSFTRLALITELTTKLQDLPYAQRYNISLGEDKFPLILATEFTDSKGHECKILNSNIKDILYISACKSNGNKWDIQFIE